MKDTATDRYIVLDEEGYFSFDGKRVDDPEYGAQLINNIKADERGRLTTSLNNQPAFVEAFEGALLARHVSTVNGDTGKLDLNYGCSAEFKFGTLSTDEWDRFHGRTAAGIPFVFSRSAQVEFFDLLDSFDDDSITIKGKTYPVTSWLKPLVEIGKQKFWSDRYVTNDTPWDKNCEHPALAEILPQLKLSKAKVLVLGCGRGHDAAFLANAGHIVTAVDISTEAIAEAKQLYGKIETLNFVQGDAFEVPNNWTGRFDLVFEHTCYCAVPPERRNDLVKTWRKVLAPQGRLLAIFFVNERREGPPFGGSEWEVRERLRKGFSFLYWTRWRRSLDNRKGDELVVFAQKI